MSGPSGIDGGVEKFRSNLPTFQDRSGADLAFLRSDAQPIFLTIFLFVRARSSSRSLCLMCHTLHHSSLRLQSIRGAARADASKAKAATVVHGETQTEEEESGWRWRAADAPSVDAPENTLR